MNKCHTPIGWQNNTTPALNETNLNYMDGCIETIDDRVVAMDTAKLEAEDVENVIAGVTMDDATGIFTFTKYDGSTFTIDTKLEKIAVNFRYDTATQKLIITLDDGTTQEVDLSSLIHETDFADSSTIVWTVTNHVATASIKANSIGDAQMQTGYLTDAQNAKNGAELAATSANTSRLESEGWAVGKQDGVDVPSTSPYYHNNAKYFADYAGGNALSALTDVQISEAEDGQTLLYNGTLNKWVNGAGTQFATLPVSNLSAVAGDETVTLTWTNPSDVIVGGTTVAELEMIKVYRDNVLIERALMSTFTDTGLVNGQTYVYTVVAETTKGVESDVATISATPVATGLSITLNGAKNDVISVYDEEDTLIDTITFESGETSGLLVLDNAYIGQTLKFESSVAKGTTDATASQNYVRRTKITDGMTVINVMPDVVGYWYGNSKLGAWNGQRGGSQGTVTFTNETNDIKMVASGLNGDNFHFYSEEYPDNDYDYVCCNFHLDGIQRQDYTAKFFVRGSKNNIRRGTAVTDLNAVVYDGIKKLAITESSVTESTYFKVYMTDLMGGTFTLRALWFENSASVTLTVEGAKEDNITIKQNGTTVGTCIFGSGQTSGTVTLDVPSDGSSVPFVFESSVAKDTTSGTSNYTKTVNVSKDTTSVKVMPESALYWYGNDVISFTAVASYPSNASTFVAPSITNNTNNLHITLPYNSGLDLGGTYFSDLTVPSGNYMCVNVVSADRKTTTGYSSIVISQTSAKQSGYTPTSSLIVINANKKTASGVIKQDISAVTTDSYVGIRCMRDGSNTNPCPEMTYSALWLE